MPVRGRPSTGESKVVQVSGWRGGHITVQDRQAPEGHGLKHGGPDAWSGDSLTEAKGPGRGGHPESETWAVQVRGRQSCDTGQPPRPPDRPPL